MFVFLFSGRAGPGRGAIKLAHKQYGVLLACIRILYSGWDESYILAWDPRATARLDSFPPLRPTGIAPLNPTLGILDPRVTGPLLPPSSPYYSRTTSLASRVVLAC